ncbi:MAG TPA: hypothetical protein VIP79_01565 [Gemmatimonadaceae bacterium]
MVGAGMAGERDLTGAARCIERRAARRGEGRSGAGQRERVEGDDAQCIVPLY